MNETKLQELYFNYNKNISRKESLEELHQLVYQYASSRFQQDFDTSSEFYLYIYDKIPHLFDEYNPKYGISFLTFLSVKLKNYYYNFSKVNKSKKQLQNNICTLEWEDRVDLKSAFQQEHSIHHDDKLVEKIRDLLLKLPKEEDITLRLYFGFYLKTLHLRYLFLVHKNFDFFPLYRDYLKKLEKKKKQEKNKKSILLAKLHIFDFHESSMSEEKRKNLKTRFTQELLHVSSLISFKEIAKIMCSSVSTVYRKLKKGLEHLKIIISDGSVDLGSLN